MEEKTWGRGPDGRPVHTLYSGQELLSLSFSFALHLHDSHNTKRSSDWASETNAQLIIFLHNIILRIEELKKPCLRLSPKTVTPPPLPYIYNHNQVKCTQKRLTVRCLGGVNQVVMVSLAIQRSFLRLLLDSKVMCFTFQKVHLIFFTKLRTLSPELIFWKSFNSCETISTVMISSKNYLVRGFFQMNNLWSKGECLYGWNVSLIVPAAENFYR